MLAEGAIGDGQRHLWISGSTGASPATAALRVHPAAGGTTSSNSTQVLSDFGRDAPQVVVSGIEWPVEAVVSVFCWAVFLGAISIAVDVLGIKALEDLVHSVWAYIPNALAGLRSSSSPAWLLARS